MHDQKVRVHARSPVRHFSPKIGLLTGFERSMIQKRVRAGLKRAKAEGKPSWSASDWCPARTANP